MVNSVNVLRLTATRSVCQQSCRLTWPCRRHRFSIVIAEGRRLWKTHRFSPTLRVLCYCRALRQNLTGPVFDIVVPHRALGLSLLLEPSNQLSKYRRFCSLVMRSKYCSFRSLAVSVTILFNADSFFL